MKNPILFGTILLVATASGVVARVGEPNENKSSYARQLVIPPAEEGCLPRNNPVCGGGTTYQNQCLALEAGETDFTNGPCKDDKHEFDNSGKKISKAEMERFQEEGFKMCGRVKLYKKQKEKGLEGEPKPGPNDKVAPGQEKKVTRTTEDGAMYKAKNFKPKNIKDDSSSAETDDPPDTEGGRQLKVFYPDTRSKVSPYTWPHWRLGEFDWGTGEGGCSGTIVGYNKILTAAHCVYDTASGRWSVPQYFAPGRYRSSSGSTIEPWGRWPVRYATVYTAWTRTGTYSFSDVKYDVAIVTMGTNWAGNIGSYMGRLQVIAAPCTIDSYSRVTGYPGDKPDGQEWTSGTCEYWNHYSCSANIVYHKCDTAPGNSGSGVYDRYERVFGVHTCGNSYVNAGYAFNSGTKDYILSWGG